jgi:hypothetical protein
VVAAAQTGAAPLAVLAAPATGDEFNTIGERLVPKACFKVEDLLFDFDSSFVRPEIGAHLPQLAQLRNDNKVQDLFPPLSIFGHADPVGNDDNNKKLSGRRAVAIYAMLVRDVDLWEQLFTNPLGKDKWGTRAVQTMLSTVQDAIAIDGEIGDETRGAIRTFQTAQGLSVDGSAGPNTRKALYRAYMDALCGPDLVLDKANDFLARNQDAGGKGDFQGCSEFNPLLLFSQDEAAAFEAASDKTDRNQENAPNRRVMILLFAAGRRVNPSVWPCPRASEGVADCKKRFFPDADVRRSFQGSRRAFEDTKDTFACRFYQIISDDSPCERVKPAPPPPPVLLGVNPLILFALAGDTVTAASAPAAGAPAAKSFVSASAPAVGAVTPLRDIVLVKKPYTNPVRVEVVLKTDTSFDGDGVLTVSDPNSILLFAARNATTPLQFNNIDNKFKGAQLDPKGPGVSLFAEGKTASANMRDFVLTLHLSGGTKKPGPDAVARMTAIELILDICAPRVNATTAPVPLPQAPAVTPATPTDKFFLGRPIPIQDTAKIQERAMLMVQPVKTAGFAALNKQLVLVHIGSNVTTFAQETPPAAPATDVVIPPRHTLFSTNTPTTFFVEGGPKESAKARDNFYQLGIDGLEGDGDRVSITVVYSEIISNKKKADAHTVAVVPEKPARTSRATLFFPAPLIVGRNFPVELLPFILLAVPTAFQWTRQEGAPLTLTDATKQVLKMTATGLSTKLDDTLVQVLVTSDLGQFLRRHRLTVVHVTIDPVANGDILKATDDLNSIKNPAGLVILSGADAADIKKVAKIEMIKFPVPPTPPTKTTPGTPGTPAALGIEPNLTWTDDDDRIAWWIVGDDGGLYKGKADFRNDETARRGTKVEVFGTKEGDVLIQPYSGGFGYGMFRANVVPLKQVKYRANRILNKAKPPAGGKPAVAEHKPTTEHADIKNFFPIMNIYLRQTGIELIPDNSVEATRHTPHNPIVGLAGLEPKVVKVDRPDPGHFDVEVNDPNLVFQVNQANQDRAIEINARNSIITFAFIHSMVAPPGLAPNTIVLASANKLPVNHAPKPPQNKPRPYSRASYTLSDSGIPSSSLIPKDGIPPNLPVGTVKLVVIDQVGVKFLAGEPGHADARLLWGVIIPTLNMDSVLPAVPTPSSPPTPADIAAQKAATELRNQSYAAALAHEVGHVLGLGHRHGRAVDVFRDGLNLPVTLNIMSPGSAPPTTENFDIIQVKAIRFSEVLTRNP